MKTMLAALALVAAVCLPLAAQAPQPGDIIITEIMANSAGAEPDQEYVEIYNVSPGVLALDGLYLQDEDGATLGIPAGTFINSGEAVVLCPDSITAADFQAAWGSGFQVFPLGPWGSGGLNNLSNSPSATNEVLTLRDAAGTLLDEANYDDSAPWPNDFAGQSIYLLSNALDAVSNDNGGNWASSQVGVNSARQSIVVGPFTGVDTGSPGVVDLGAAIFSCSIGCGQGPQGTEVQLDVSGGTAGNLYFLAVTTSNPGVAPNGWFFGIEMSFFELQTQIAGPPWFGILDAQGSFSFAIPLPGLPCPIGLSADAVALEFDAATTFLVQATAANTFNF